MPPSRRAVLTAALLTAAGGTVAGCSFPRDPDGTLDRVRGGVLLAGATANPPWTRWPDGMPADGDTGVPAGIEVELVEGFAATLDAEVRWVGGSEAELVQALEEQELQVVVGGLESTSPWVDRAALTLVYATTQDDRGDPVHHVMAVPPGENALLVALERYLLQAAP